MKQILTTLALITIALFGCKKKDTEPPKQIPLVTTAALTNAGNGNYTAGGSIVSDGGATVTQSGIVWSKTNAIPTLTDSVVAGTTATGAFTANISGINFNNTYYFRAFATNSVGTGYGSVVTLTTSSDSVRFTYNGQSVTYGIITSPITGKKWLDRNLGAKQAATEYNDWQAYGDLFQWGRPADGHQLITWTAANANENTAGTPVNGTTTTLATTDVPGHNNFIIFPYVAGTNYDWRSDNNRNRWTTIPQGPCPAGWHVPTMVEWHAEVSTTYGGTATSGGIVDRSTGYNKLKLTTAGNRLVDGPGAVNFYQVGRAGHYWSTSDEMSGTISLAKDLEVAAAYAQSAGEPKSTAKSVRCIKD